MKRLGVIPLCIAAVLCLSSVIPVNAQSAGSTDTSFTVTDDMLSKPVTYSIKVSDNFYEEDGTTLIKSEIREQKKVTEGTTYCYSPLEFKGYVSVDEEVKSGVVNNDVSITFSYYKEADEPVIEIKKYLVTVIDELYSSSGEFIESKVRCIDTYEANSNYKYEALEYDDYKVIDTYSVNGIVKDNSTITFKYKQEEEIKEIEKSYILRVRDIYYNEDGSLIRDETRFVQTDLKSGYKYKIEALKITDSYKIYRNNYKENKYEEELVTYDYYKAIGKSIIDGKLSADTDIVFQYIKCDLEGKAPDGVDNLPVPDNKPLDDTIISGDPPETGDNTNLALLIALMSISLGGVILLRRSSS